MTLIEGIGDEVVQFVGVLLVLAVGALAWWSTNARPGRYRTVVVMRSRAPHSVTVSIRTRPNLMIANNQASTSSQASSTSDTIAVSTSDAVEDTRDTSRVIPLQEMDSIIDADMAMLDNNRLHFYRRIDSPSNTTEAADPTGDDSETQEEAEPASNAQIREMDSIVSAMEADVTTGCEFFTRPTENNATAKSAKSVKKGENVDNNIPSSASNVDNKRSEENNVNIDSSNSDNGTTSNTDNPEINNSQMILIKLKYLNDTLKEVEGSLDEPLKDFKLRHFSTELSSECRVRLIFNGHVLLDDAATLRACGLHDRAVVHCLVHPKRTSVQAHRPEDSPTNPELVSEGPQQERPWDLENILMTLVSVALTVVWFFRCEYSNMFTASASVALFGLTVFYSVAIFGLYLSDTFHFDRRPAQPVPAN
ncbi:unnamed protein product [Chilo suppressalis]|uniref:Ubiquitin-like domain-containing protein n=1 Tax=Chilo suppressalis TaxID=168631 RepID=A0ABN8L5K1_CHISP|nr:unnamed protein product [Chilo suppressalis]